jgi:hypothetical protein
MCLTLANAATIHHHTDPTGTAARGYTATAHHAGHLTPGDQWRPMLTDQYGSTWTYPANAVIPTAVPDPLHIHISTTAHGGTR